MKHPPCILLRIQTYSNPLFISLKTVKQNNSVFVLSKKKSFYQKIISLRNFMNLNDLLKTSVSH